MVCHSQLKTKIMISGMVVIAQQMILEEVHVVDGGTIFVLTFILITVNTDIARYFGVHLPKSCSVHTVMAILFTGRYFHEFHKKVAFREM